MPIHLPPTLRLEEGVLWVGFDRFYMKTHGSVFPLDAINIGENIRCLFPIMWVRHYKKIKKFSYMIQIKPRKGYNDSTDITYIEMQ